LRQIEPFVDLLEKAGEQAKSADDSSSWIAKSVAELLLKDSTAGSAS
jgi:hypothetical protein